MCGVFRYNMSAESPAKSTLSQGHGLSTVGGSAYIYMYIWGDFVFDPLKARPFGGVVP